MSNSVFPVPRLTFQLNDGSPAASGTLTFYAAGTVNLLDVYSDKALNTAVPNPLTLNSAGRPEVSGTEVNLYGGDALYDVVFKNSAGTTIWTAEDVAGQPSEPILPDTFAVGDLLYADTTSSLARRAAVASGQVFASAGVNTAPAYTATPTVTTLTATTLTTTSLVSTTARATAAVIVGTADTSGIRLDLEGGVLVVREGDDSADAELKSSTLTVTGGQIEFPATQVPSSSANILDDYEEGDWTPVLGGSSGQSGQTYTAQHGEYVKIGKWVWCTCTVTLSAKGTINGDLQISGLPFSVDTSADSACAFGDFDATATNQVWVAGIIGSAGVVTLRNKDAASTSMGTMDTNDVGNSTACEGIFYYRADQ